MAIIHFTEFYYTNPRALGHLHKHIEILVVHQYSILFLSQFFMIDQSFGANGSKDHIIRF